MSVEAACTAGWGEFADAFVGIDVFGASAPGGTCDVANQSFACRSEASTSSASTWTTW